MATTVDRVRRLVDRRGEVSNRDVVAALHVSSATAHRLLSALVTSGVLERLGKGRAARYRLRGVRRRFRRAGLDEHRAWAEVAAEIARIRPLDAEAARSLAYAASEIVNNAIDHSAARTVEVTVAFERAGTTVLTVRDDGVGVFRRLSEDFGYATPEEAIVQLEKGKLTSDPTRHSGEGLFFSSKAVTRFRLEGQARRPTRESVDAQRAEGERRRAPARGVAWIVDNPLRDSAIGPSHVRSGTRVRVELVPGQVPRLADLFAAYTDPESLHFTRTRATIKLSAIGTTFVSRSEAKRLVARLTEFRQATLDFSGVEVVGQGFCDEVFRVYALAHPEVALEPVGMNDTVSFMVGRARAAAAASR